MKTFIVLCLIGTGTALVFGARMCASGLSYEERAANRALENDRECRNVCTHVGATSYMVEMDRWGNEPLCHCHHERTSP